MNYKTIISNQSIRYSILNFLSWIPDKQMIKIQYKIKTGRTLNLKNPRRYSEKLQWYKLYYRNPKMRQCVDKYEVRGFVKNKKLGNILNELYGVYDNPEDIDFKKLPNEFVIKTTLGGGGKNILICNNKKDLNEKNTIRLLHKWLKQYPKKHYGREWAYEGGKNKIIIEKLLKDKNGLVDYKFFCFNGRVRYIYAISDRELGKTTKLGIYDSNFKKLQAYRADEGKQTKPHKKPASFSRMIEYAEKLSSDFPHARIDFYENNGKIIFGEITFYDGSGYMTYEPDSFDVKMGDHFATNKEITQ